MKRVITVLIMAVMMLTAITCTSYGATDGFSYKTTKTGGEYVTRFYKSGEYMGKIKTSKKLAVKVVKSEKLTAHVLEHRKGNYILVEVVKGKCIDNAGNGKTSDGYYISYKRVKGHKKGAMYTTYCVYANNNYIDDVAVRADIIK